MTKNELRQMLRRRQQLLAAVSAEADARRKEAESASVVARLLAHPLVRRARAVALYYPLPDEVDIRQLADQLQEAVVLLPRVVSSEAMEWRRYTGAADLRAGAFGIMEPVGEPFVRYDLIDVAVVPGMAFDAQGHRLGRGRGYYDRFLSRHPHIYKIGVCFSERLLDSVPTGEHDVPMDEVIVS